MWLLYIYKCGNIVLEREVVDMLNYDFIPCEECCDCAYYWQNTDTENECVGEDKPCHEFIEFKGIGH